MGSREKGVSRCTSETLDRSSCSTFAVQLTACPLVFFCPCAFGWVHASLACVVVTKQCNLVEST